MTAAAAAVTGGRAAARVSAIAIAIAGFAAVAALILAGPAVIRLVLGLLGDELAHTPLVVELVYYVVIFGSMLVLAVAGGALTGVRALALGRGRARAIVTGLALGSGGLLATLAYAALAGTVSRGEAGGISSMLLIGVPVVALQVLAEEAYFRGWLQPLLARGIGTPAAVVTVALAFAALHLIGGANGPSTLVNLGAGGLMFGLLAARGGGIAGSTAAHFAWNVAEQLVFGLDPNPGAGTFGSLFDFDLAGPALWGGSEQGLNASLGMTFALAAILALLLPGWRRPARPAA